MSIFAAIILALIISLLFAPGYRRGSFAPLIIFFFVLFMAGIASQYWIIPFGPAWWGISWMPLLFILLIFTFLLAAPSTYERKAAKTNNTPETEPVAATAISIFIWLLLLMLSIAILIGFFSTPVS